MSPDADPFESPKLLLDGARHDIKNFDVESRVFLDSCFGVPSQKIDRKTGENVVKYHVPQRMPGHLRVLASNAVNNLRHTLDQAVNCAAVGLGGKRDNYFPFAKDATDIDRIIKDNCKSVRADLLPTLKGFQPYGGGDDVLYSLSRIAGPNKHQLVLKTNLDLTHLVLNDLASEIRGPSSVGLMHWGSKKQEFEFARIGSSGYIKCNPKAKLPLSISLGDSKISSSEPATTFLETLASKVDGILGALEADTERLSHLSPTAGKR
jgi:hypothetical protein